VSLTCNIDQRGRKARLISGIVVDACGAGLIVAGVLTGATWMIVVGAVASASGTFMIFEGAKGWCALRAMGMKTPL
jgi:hypothetical protein